MVEEIMQYAPVFFTNFTLIELALVSWSIANGLSF